MLYHPVRDKRPRELVDVQPISSFNRAQFDEYARTDISYRICAINGLLSLQIFNFQFSVTPVKPNAFFYHRNKFFVWNLVKLSIEDCFRLLRHFICRCSFVSFDYAGPFVLSCPSPSSPSFVTGKHHLYIKKQAAATSGIVTI